MNNKNGLTLSQTTHFRLFQIESLQTTILDLIKMADSSSKGRKTLLEKEKLLVTSNFSYSHSVFKRLVLKTGKNQGLFGKGLIDVDYHLYACKTDKGMIAPFNLKKKINRTRRRKIKHS